VAGVFSGVVGVESILKLGDIGLGTFANLDGEMVVLDGRAYQVQASGKVSNSVRRDCSVRGRDAISSGGGRQDRRSRVHRGSRQVLYFSPNGY
jgi:hypothetical protein